MEPGRIGSQWARAFAVARKRKGDATRKKILSVATCVFAKQGYNDVSLRQVCTEAEVNIALISCHYGTRRVCCSRISNRAADQREARAKWIGARGTDRRSFTQHADFTDAGWRNERRSGKTGHAARSQRRRE